MQVIDGQLQMKFLTLHSILCLHSTTPATSRPGARIVTPFVTAFLKKTLGKMRFVTTSRPFAPLCHPPSPSTGVRRSRLWKVTEAYGSLRKVTEGYGRLRKATEGYGRLRKVAEGYGRLTTGLPGAPTSQNLSFFAPGSRAQHKSWGRSGRLRRPGRPATHALPLLESREP